MKRKYALIFEDDHFLVVNKESGILVIPGRSANKTSLKDLLTKIYNQIFIVHRIDEQTSGIIIVAKTADAHQRMNTLFQDRKIEKSYLLFTNGIPNKSGTIEMPLKKLNNQNKSIVHRDGKNAISHYILKETFGNIAYCESTIETGRHHQLRVHFKTIGCPLLVDPIYGKSSFYLSEIKGKKYKKSKDDIERPILNRLSLHASKLSFQHPYSGEQINLEAPLPKDFKACLNQFRKVYG